MTKTHHSFSLLAVLLVFIAACSTKNTNSSPQLKKAQVNDLFELVDPKLSGVDFNNLIRDSQDFLIFNYEYAYNGGGVAIGDINNDNLPDLYFSGTFVGNKLYLNQGNMKFKDITQQAGVDGGQGFKTGVSMVDINHDGFLDIYVCKSGNFGSDVYRTNLLYINQGNLTFKEEAHAYGLDDKSFSTQAYFSDIDIDGDLDMFLVNHAIGWGSQNNLNLQMDNQGVITQIRDTARFQVSSRLYINDHDHFKDKTLSYHVDGKEFGLSAMIADFNEDNYPDIFVGIDYINPDHFFINNKGQSFTDKVNDYFANITMSSMGCDAFDINGDKKLDLFVNDMMPEDYFRLKQNINLIKNYDSHIVGKKYNYHDQFRFNAMHIMSENGLFENCSFYTGTHSTDWSWSVLGEDFDANGHNDIFITNGYLKDIVNIDYAKYTLDSLKRFYNNNQFYGEWEKRVPTAKLVNYFYSNNGKLEFDNVSKVWCEGKPSFSNGAAYADLDLDGDLDLVVNNINDPAFLMKNKLVEMKKNIHHLNIKLVSKTLNKAGYGAELTAITQSGAEVVKLFNPFRGYMSSMDQRCYFGSGEPFKEVVVKWPGGKSEKFNITSHGQVILEEGKGNPYQKTKPNNQPIFVGYTTPIVHKENEFVDFKAEPLLHMKNSVEGPALVVADFDKDGNDDVFFGGAAGQSGAVYSLKTGSPVAIPNPNLEADAAYEDIAAVAGDFDKDGDSDLLIASGGYQFPENDALYAVRLYLNNGKGQFERNKSLLPEYKTNANSICTADFDGDGDLDVFIGGGALHSNYPNADHSLYLKNENGKFIHVKEALPQDNAYIVKDCEATDINGDKLVDLVVCGDFSPIRILINKNGKFEDRSADYGIENSLGLWQNVFVTDLDGDGQKDILAGNLGLNSYFKASDNYPFKIYHGDLDNNGEQESVMSQYFNGVEYPVHCLDKILQQSTKLRKKFLRYSTFSHTEMNDIYDSKGMQKATVYKATTFESSIFIQKNGKFIRSALPAEAQFSMVRSIEKLELGGKNYILITGNFFDTDFEFGKYDASHGALFGVGKNGKLEYISKSGINAHGNVRHAASGHLSSGKQFVVVANNNAPLELYKQI